jgi:hypothetical protein
MYPLHCPKDPFYSRQDKDFLYLWLPYIGGEFILWNFVLHVCPTWGHLLTRAKQDYNCVLHSYNTNAEPSNIQSEKQRCERCCEENMRKVVSTVIFMKPLYSG